MKRSDDKKIDYKKGKWGERKPLMVFSLLNVLYLTKEL